MGQFPYECAVCGGGYKRCGNQYDNRKISFNMSKDGTGCNDCDGIPDYECKGGQFCWEEKCVIIYNDKPVFGFYSGYGYLQEEVPITDKDIEEYTAKTIIKKLKKNKSKGRKNINFKSEMIEIPYVKLNEKVKYYPIHFEEFFDCWFRDRKLLDEDEKDVDHRIGTKIYCASCYHKSQKKSK
jgi:hypothetical protein